MSAGACGSLPRRSLIALAACFVFGVAHAEQFVATPTRVVGPHTAGQTTPAPGGGWQASDDRTLGASVVGQQGWTGTCSNQNYDQEIVAGIAHTGGHGWRLSNWYHNGCVNHVISPAFAPIGETGSTTIINGGGTGPLTNTVVYEFWFRKASTQAEPGTYTSTTITDQLGRRMTYLGFFDELPGAGNGCPGDGNCFHLDASGVTDGGLLGPGNDDSVVFDDHYSPPLGRDQWYKVHIDATFNDTTGESTRRNDVVNYALYDANGNQVWAANGVNTWEDAYYRGHYGSNVGDKVASNYVAYRISADPDTGDQSDGDTYAVTNRPHGIVFDDLKITPGGGQQGYATSFDFDRYVATNGSDNSDCTNPSNPCLTIVYAINQANPYDTIHVAKGVYAERSSSTSNLIINKPVAIVGAQAGVDARTRDLGGANDANETILVPGVQDGSLTLGSLGNSAVVTIAASGVSIDGVVIDGANPNFASGGVALNGARVDVDSGVFASGGNNTLQNIVLRNFIGAGIFACEDLSSCASSLAGGDNLIQHDRFTNITDPSSWGIGIYAGDQFYAQIQDNLFDQVRVGVQFDENNHLANPGTQIPTIARNEIHATRIGLFWNLFYQSASTWTVADNTIYASASASETGEWRGVNIESMQDAQTAVISGNVIDGSALAGSGRRRVGYILNNWTSSQAANTAVSGGSVSNVDVGVLATDASYYTGPVAGALVQGIAFNNIGLGAIYVEDTNEQSGSAAATVGAGNTYANVPYQLVLAGSAPAVSFSGGAGVSSVLVRAAGTYYYGSPGSSYGPCKPTPCTVANASINAGIAAVSANGTVYIEQGTFNETGIVGTGKDGVRVTAADAANPPTLTRASGGPNQPVFVVAGTPLGASPGAAPKNVQIDHLNFAVDKHYAAEGLLVSGFVDGLSIHDNAFTQSWSTTATPNAGYRFTNAISINLDPAHNSLGTPRVDGSKVTIQNNTIAGSTSPNATMFRAGIAMDAGVGTIAGNTSSALNHDAIVRFATVVSGGGNGLTISGNHFGGGGLEFDAPNAGVTPIAISGNTINAASVPPAILAPALSSPQTSVEADFSTLRLIDNYQKLPVTVNGNTFAGYANGLRGALIENFPNVTLADNTFAPLANAADFASLVVSNKEINTDNPPEAPYPMTLTALRNTFNGSGTANAGRAVEFIDDNDANGTASFGAIAFGDNTAANANQFDANHKFYFNLVDQNCDTRVPPGNAPQCTFIDYNGVGAVQNTQVRAFRGNVYAVNNLFGGVMPGAMSPTQQAALNAQTNDINDDTALGYVDYGLYHVVLAVDGPVANVQATVPTDYSARLTNTGTALAENVLVQFSISRAAGIQAGDLTLQYFDGSQYQSIPLTACGANLCGTFGPQPGGFPVPAGYDATTALRATYAVADTFTVQATVQGVGSNVIYAQDTHSTQVVRTPANLSLNLMGPPGTSAGLLTSYSAQLTNTGGATSENVLVDFAISRPAGLGAGDIVLEYNTGSGYAAIPLSACNSGQLCGSFGPPGGFAVGVGYNVTTALVFGSKRAGAITVNASVDGVTSHGSYAASMMTVQVNAAAAANIAANSATSFSGTAGTAASPLPSVVVTDAYGNPVTGYGVVFAAGANSGVLFGTSQSTNAGGIATLGGWTLGTAPSETVTVTDANLQGSPITFTANVSASFDLSVSFPSINKPYAQYGKTLEYTIVVSNAGPSTASNAVSDVLPAEFVSGSGSWVCYATTPGAYCGAAKGTGDLHDTPTLPSGGSVTYVLSASVRSDAALTTETITNQVSVATGGDGNTANNTATATTQLVIFRDSFEVGGDGANTTAVVPPEVK